VGAGKSIQSQEGMEGFYKRECQVNAVFRFLSGDWSPWIALLRMRERWPELRVPRPSVVETLETSIWVPRSSLLLARAGQFIDERLR
jgi:hypothetical protein